MQQLITIILCSFVKKGSLLSDNYCRFPDLYNVSPITWSSLAQIDRSAHVFQHIIPLCSISIQTCQCPNVRVRGLNGVMLAGPLQYCDIYLSLVRGVMPTPLSSQKNHARIPCLLVSTRISKPRFVPSLARLLAHAVSTQRNNYQENTPTIIRIMTSGAPHPPVLLRCSATANTRLHRNPGLGAVPSPARSS